MVEAEEEYTEQLEILISCFLRPFKVEDSHILNDSGVARSFSFSFVFGSVSLKSRSSDGGQLKESSVLSRRFELHLPQCRNCPFPSPGGNEKCWCSLKRWLHCLFVPQAAITHLHPPKSSVTCSPCHPWVSFETCDPLDWLHCWQLRTTVTKTTDRKHLPSLWLNDFFLPWS